jgi:hypothetical protein
MVLNVANYVAKYPEQNADLVVQDEFWICDSDTIYNYSLLYYVYRYVSQ